MALAWLTVAAVCAVLSLVCIYRAGYSAAERSYKWRLSASCNQHALTIGMLNVALGTLTVGEIADALKNGTTDKVQALLLKLREKTSKIMLDHQAVEAEFSEPKR